MKLKAVLDKIFTDRQIIISTRGQLKYFRLGVSAQVMAMTVAIGFGGMFTYYLATETSQEKQLVAQTAQLFKLKNQYETAFADLQLASSTLDATQTELDQQYARLEGMLAERKNVESALKLASKTKKSSEDLTSEERVRALGESLHTSNTQRERLELEIMQVNKALFQTAQQRDQAANDRLKTEQKLSSLRMVLNMYASTKDEIYSELQETKQEFARLQFDRQEKIDTEFRLSSEISGLKSRLTNISSENKELIARVNDRAHESIMALKEVISITGLDSEKILGSTKILGQGGPYVDFKPTGDMLQMEQSFYEEAQKMEASLARWESLQTILKHIPLARPVDVGYVTSSYGKRRDPMTKRKAHHSGVDIAGPKNSKILATAPGVVTFVGTNGAYGRMVTIDHGKGFKTRYGHLKKTVVKKGDKIDFRTQIGVMGSTGRSTGRHVHYEVIFDGKHRDPVKFFKAGKYAFKVTPKIQEASNK
ncbi:MAG: peptidoglycan DD-metalloendopeptidase family protein [Sneathiella sp.]|uniref:peptidoglycan DD-metalloendopeptidase family protein n=1 Tax=Sneathiella sp. TaxID=1964365 RepID=UPI003001CFCD